MPPLDSGNGNEKTNCTELGNRGKSFTVVEAFYLAITLHHQLGLIVFNSTVRIEFNLVNAFAPNDLLVGW